MSCGSGPGRPFFWAVHSRIREFREQPSIFSTGHVTLVFIHSSSLVAHSSQEAIQVTATNYIAKEISISSSSINIKPLQDSNQPTQSFASYFLKIDRG